MFLHVAHSSHFILCYTIGHREHGFEASAIEGYRQGRAGKRQQTYLLEINDISLSIIHRMAK